MMRASPKQKNREGGPFGRVVTRSEAQTLHVAEELASGFKGTEVVLLSGELGAGKTVFAKGLAAGLGVEDAGRVCSPSYTLVNIYRGRVPVFHIDLYRLEKDSEIRDLGWEEYLGEGVVIVEWAERLPFPVDGIRVAIESGPDETRTITIHWPLPLDPQLQRALEGRLRRTRGHPS